MGTNNIGFHGELTKIIIKYLPYLFFCGIITYNYINANYCFYNCENDNFQNEKMWHFFPIFARRIGWVLESTHNLCLEQKYEK